MQPTAAVRCGFRHGVSLTCKGLNVRKVRNDLIDYWGPLRSDFLDAGKRFDTCRVGAEAREKPSVDGTESQWVLHISDH